MARVIAGGQRWRGERALVIQSDDWGYCGWSPTREAYGRLEPLLTKRHGRKGEIWGLSTLEDPSDLENLFQLLEQYRDARGRHPSFQAGYVMGNPDYDLMKAEAFRCFHHLYLPRLPALWQRGDIVGKAREGMGRGVWRSVYHGAHHFHPWRWLERLACDPAVRSAAEDGCFLGDGSSGDFEFGFPADLMQLREILRCGLEAFQRCFGFQSEAAIFPAYYWTETAELALAGEGVGVLHGKNCQLRRQNRLELVRGKLYNLLGWKDSAKTWQITCGDYRADNRLRYLARNVFFEPYLDRAWNERSSEESVAAALAAAEKAWQEGEPAVMITHRINYVGWHGDQGRSLECLDRLLAQLAARGARFITDLEAATGDRA